MPQLYYRKVPAIWKLPNNRAIAEWSAEQQLTGLVRPFLHKRTQQQFLHGPRATALLRRVRAGPDAGAVPTDAGSLQLHRPGHHHPPGADRLPLADANGRLHQHRGGAARRQRPHWQDGADDGALLRRRRQQ